MIIKIAILILTIIVIIVFLLKLLVIKKYNVVFKDESVKSYTMKISGKVEKPKDLVKEGYKFVGWYLDNNLYDFNTEVKENINLKAKWEKIENTNMPNNTPNNAKPSNKTTTPQVEKDTIKPNITNLTAISTTCEITVSLSATDNKTPTNKLVKTYSIDGTNYNTNNKFTGLKQNKDYVIYVRVKDKAGNITQKTLNVKTKVLEKPKQPVFSTTNMTPGPIDLTFENNNYTLDFQ